MTLIVGPEEIHFTWFRDVLSFHSLFFANALKHDRYPEARDGKIKMPEDSADAVREFIRWITDHRLGGYGPGSDNEDMTTEDYWHLLVEIYVFGHKYDVPRLQNVAIDRIISFFQDEAVYPRAETVEKMYGGTHDEDDPGRRIIVDLVCHSKMNIPAYLQDHQKCGGNHPDFCADVAKKLWDLATDERGYQRFRMDREDWNCVSRCDYHVSEVDSHFNGRKVG